MTSDTIGGVIGPLASCYRRAVDDATLAGLEHENLLATFTAAIGNAPGGFVRRADGVAVLASGLPIAFFNQITIENDRATAEGVAAAVAVMRERGQPFVVHVRQGTDDRFRSLMDALGLTLPAGVAPMPGMALYPIPRSRAALPLGHEIRRITDAQGMEDHVRTCALGFGMPADMLRAIVGPATWQHPATTVYVGYTGGQPVTAGLSVRTGRTVGVYNIATIESARRHGLGAAMTERVVADAAAEGCDVAILQSSEMGRPVYERLGYRTVVEYDGYGEPGAAAGH
jgi:GNAT superfamily N-acetyltransferase